MKMVKLVTRQSINDKWNMKYTTNLSVIIPINSVINDRKYNKYQTKLTGLI